MTTETTAAQEALDHLSDPASKPSEYEFARAVVLSATCAGVTVATAESLTGGMLAQMLTSVPGASQAFRGSVVAYHSDIKAGVLNVSESLLERHGAVHIDVAIQMARGVSAVLGADIGVGITGVAGPLEHDGAPVGQVHLAVFDGTTSEVRAHSLNFMGTRDDIRVQSAIAAMGMLLDVIVAKTDLIRS